VAQSTSYTPFGDPTTATLLASTPEEHSFIGERFDTSTGLLYLNTRYYDPLLGRFLQPDWWEVRQAGVGTNRYAYSFNDPVNLSDPNGNACIPCIGAIVGGIIGGAAQAASDIYSGELSGFSSYAGAIGAGAASGATFGLGTTATVGGLAIKGAASGVAGTTVGSLVETGELPSAQELAGGAIVGALLGPAERFVPSGIIPHGFRNAGVFRRFSSSVNNGLESAGFRNTTAIMQGSAVTGQSFRSGRPFSQLSDFDLALAGDSIFERAVALGIKTRSQGTRTGPLTPENIAALGLSDFREALSIRAGREVNFMIFRSVDTALEKAPSIVLPR